MNGRSTFAVMRIAVNARCVSDTNMGAGYWTFHLFEKLVHQYPEHEFLFVSDVPSQLNFGTNASFKVNGKPAKGLFQFNRWLDGKFCKTAGSADTMISLDATGSIRSTVPQIIGVTDLRFLRSGSLLERFFKKKRFQKLLTKADKIVTISAYTKQDIMTAFVTDEKKIQVIPKAPTAIFQPTEWQQKEIVKEQYTGGREYFLFTGGFDPNKNLLTILKAFSRFKKWQQSNMKLVIVGNITDDPLNLKELINTFKFRNDVVVLDKLSAKELHPLVASAYALIYTPLKQTFGMPVLEAMRSGTAVICSATVATEVSGDAVLYVDAGDESDIGHQMIKLYQDEDLRNRLIEAGLFHSSTFNWNTIAEQMWKLIEETVQQAKGS